MEANNNMDQTIILTKEVPQKNTVGIIGFVMTIIGLIFCWTPLVKWLLLIPAFILSFIGMFKKPRAIAVIGTILCSLVILGAILVGVFFVNAITSM